MKTFMGWSLKHPTAEGDTGYRPKYHDRVLLDQGTEDWSTPRSTHDGGFLDKIGEDRCETETPHPNPQTLEARALEY